MGFDPGPVIVAIGGAVASIIGAWALYTKAGIAGASPGLVLRRLWDWIEGADLATKVPPTLARDVRRELGVTADEAEEDHDQSA